jgi:hypothetical protein|tara:strand:+ start:75 stop:467 length:393 start_codon:yes stop_codon:yes gene_type:complete
MIPNKMYFIEEEALNIFLKQLGWKVTNPRYYNNLILFKPDFYPEGHIFALSEPYGKGYVYTCGFTIIEYKDEVFDSVNKLIERFGHDSISDFNNWKFVEEKEWVVTRTGKEFLTTFTSLDTVPKRNKYIR